jgi:hypothetical protein
MLQPKEQGGHPQSAANVESRIRAAQGKGEPLSESARNFLEPRFGVDFSGVRVHTDKEADDLGKAIQARAFATGSDVFFRSGEYDPERTEGRRLLAHELAHVVQHASGVARQVEQHAAEATTKPKAEESDVAQAPAGKPEPEAKEQLVVSAKKQLKGAGLETSLQIAEKAMAWGEDALAEAALARARKLMTAELAAAIGDFDPTLAGRDEIKDLLGTLADYLSLKTDDLGLYEAALDKIREAVTEILDKKIEAFIPGKSSIAQARDLLTWLGEAQLLGVPGAEGPVMERVLSLVEGAMPVEGTEVAGETAQAPG